MTTTEHATLGPYVLLRMLGRGGMAEVWEAARRDQPDVRVAIKRLPFGDAQSRGSERRLLDEASLGAALSHPNLARTIDVVRETGRVAVVMELLHGQTLSSVIHPSQVPPLGWTLGVALQILEGLAYLHAASGASGRSLQLVHRDIKPSNLFVTDDGVAKVIDFGIASLQGSERTATGTGMLRGSLPYCSPEMARHQPLDLRSDLFSFGLVLHEMLTGERCHPQTTEAAILSAVLWVPTPPVRQTHPDVPIWLDELVSRLLEKDRERRPASATEVAALVRARAAPEEIFSAERIAAWLAQSQRMDSVRAATASGHEVNPPAALLPRDSPEPPLPVAAAASRPSRARGTLSPLLKGVGWALTAGLILLAGVTVGSRWREDPIAPTSAVTEPEPVPPAQPLPPPAPAAAAPEAAKQRAPLKPATRRTARAVAPTGRGWLTVAVKPGWANVEVNGKKVGPTPLFRHALPAGRHTVAAVRRDGKRQQQEVVIRDGEERRLALEWPDSP